MPLNLTFFQHPSLWYLSKILILSPLLREREKKWCKGRKTWLTCRCWIIQWQVWEISISSTGHCPLNFTLISIFRVNVLKTFKLRCNWYVEHCESFICTLISMHKASEVSKQLCVDCVTIETERWAFRWIEGEVRGVNTGDWESFKSSGLLEPAFLADDSYKSVDWKVALYAEISEALPLMLIIKITMLFKTKINNHLMIYAVTRRYF